jgi:DNA-binding transcriptional LysR family regulator
MRRLSLKDLAQQTVILYPAQPRPSFADQVLAHFRVRGCPIQAPFETNGLQTAVGLVAAGIGVSLVPRSVQRFRREDIVYRPISDSGIVSPMLMTTRVDDRSEDLRTLCAAVQAACGEGPRSDPAAGAPAGVKPRRSRKLTSG